MIENSIISCFLLRGSYLFSNIFIKRGKSLFFGDREREIEREKQGEREWEKERERERQREREREKEKEKKA